MVNPLLRLIKIPLIDWWEISLWEMHRTRIDYKVFVLMANKVIWWRMPCKKEVKWCKWWTKNLMACRKIKQPISMLWRSTSWISKWWCTSKICIWNRLLSTKRRWCIVRMLWESKWWISNLDNSMLSKSSQCKRWNRTWVSNSVPLSLNRKLKITLENYWWKTPWKMLN